MNIIIDHNLPGVAYICDKAIVNEVVEFMVDEGAAVHLLENIPEDYEIIKVTGVSMTSDNWGLIIEE